MSKSHRLSSASASCRIEWRPSRWVASWLAGLVLLAPISLVHSALPRPQAWPLALIAGIVAFRQWHGYRRRGAITLIVRADGPLEVDGVIRPEWQLRWRGPLAFVQWREGDRRLTRALSFWPDTLPPAPRRELRLATPITAAVSPAVGMAT